MDNDFKFNNSCKLTDAELIKLGREVVNWSVPQPFMTTYDEVKAAFDSRTDLYGHLIGFADSVSDVLYGGECAWCKDNDRQGLKEMIAELRKRK